MGTTQEEEGRTHHTQFGLQVAGMTRSLMRRPLVLSQHQIRAIFPHPAPTLTTTPLLDTNLLKSRHLKIVGVAAAVVVAVAVLAVVIVIVVSFLSSCLLLQRRFSPN